MASEYDWELQLLMFYAFSTGYSVYNGHFKTCFINLQYYFALTTIVIFIGLIAAFFVLSDACKKFWTKLRIVSLTIMFILVGMTTPLFTLISVLDSSCISNVSFFIAMFVIFGIIDLTMYIALAILFIIIYAKYRRHLARIQSNKRVEIFYKEIYKKSQKQINKFLKKYKDILEKGEISEKETIVLKDRYTNLIVADQVDIPEEDKESCSICICEFEKGEEVTIHPSCKHMFHYECIVQWLKVKNICPLCKVSTRIQMLKCFHKKNNRIPRSIHVQRLVYNENGDQ